MTSRRRPGPRSLRVQLALVGFLAVVVPVVVLLGVVLVSVRVETERTDVGPGGTEETVDTAEEVAVGVPSVVPVTAALLALPAALVSWWWAGRATRGIERITATTDRIQAGSLDERIALDRAPEEVQALADSFDRMLGRLADASTVQRRLVEDVSHELRTALAALATTAEVALADPRADLASLRAAMARVDALATRLQTTLEALLADARARGHELRQVDNDLAAIVRRVADDQRALTPGVAVVVRAPDELRCGVDGPSVERAVRNLVANAVRFGGGAGPVEVALRTDDGRALLSVTDRGPGIAPVERERVFERYWRGDATEDPGHGIGLALVRAVADAYGGVEVESPVGPHGGSRFTLRFDLPRAAHDR